ncbi:MAG: oligosaccharide flippase family protein [Synechococcales bacterium]|nr:oligosaccharide flippase family protein [Synechococcales bacterium]
MSSLLQKQAIRGTAWTIAGYGFSQGLRLASNLVLTRLLVPEMFGLMALVSTFITGLNLFSDIGIRPGIIRSKRGDDPVFLNTAWTIQLIRGVGLWLCCIIIAYPTAQYYGDPRITWILPVAGFTTVLAGLKSTDLHRLNRHMAIGKLAAFDAVIQLVSITVMVVWAYFSPSIWALLAGGLASKAVEAIWSHFIFPGSFNHFAWEKEALKELVKFGRWIFVATAMTFLAAQSDKLMLGKLLSIETLGIYSVAYTMAYLVREIVQKINVQVTLPVLSRLSHLPPATVKSKILPKRRSLLIVLSFLIVFMAGFGDYIILFLYDSRYDQASWMLPLLVLGLWPLLLSMTIDKTLYAIGKPIYSAIGNTLKLIYMIVLMPLAAEHVGIVGVILVIAFNDLPYYIATGYGLWREKFSVIGQDIQATVFLFALCSLVIGSRYLLGFGTPFDLIFQVSL